MNYRIKIIVMLAAGAFAIATARATNLDVQWDNGAGNNDWSNPTNWSGNVLPSTGLGTTGDKIHINLNGANRAIFSATTGTKTYQLLRIGDSADGELEISGGSLSSDSTTVSYVGNGHTGIVTQTGGSLNFGGYMEVGLGANGIGDINLFGGTLTSSRNGTIGGVTSVSIALGDGNNAQGNFILSGGELITRTGILLGNNGGKGRFELDGAGAAEIGSNNSADDGFWVQNSGSTLAAYVTNGSLGTIFIDKVAGTGGIYGNGNVIFMPGSLLEVGFHGAPTNGSWTLMRWGGALLTNGLAFAPGTDPNWHFTADNTNGLVITYGTRAPVVTNTTFVHPGVMHTLADLDRMKTNILAGNQPWYSGYTKLLADSHSSSSYAMEGPLTTITRDAVHPVLPTAWQDDCGAAYQNALLWYLTGDPKHAVKAIQILDAWSSNCTNFNGSDARLTAGLQGFKFITAAELIRYTGAGWSQSEIATCSNFIRNVILPVNRMYGGGNWGQCGAASAMAAGVFLNDEAVFNEALNAIKYGAPTECDMGIQNYINPGGWTTEADRDIGHWGLGLDNICQASWTAWCQGIDLWTFLDNRLLAGHEYLAYYNATTNELVSYIAGSQCDGLANGKITTLDLGEWNYLWEQVYNPYQNMIGIAAPWSSNAVTHVRPEGFDRDHIAFGTLVCALPPRAPGLPIMPSGLSATWSNGQVQLTWNASSSATGYKVKRATSRGGIYTNIANVVTTSYTDTTVSNDTLYFYKVSATNGAGETVNSGLASAYPSANAPTAPSGLVANAISHVRIDLAWNSVLGATSYIVKRSTTNGGPYSIIATGAGTTFLTYPDTGLTPNTTYHYTISATNNIGESSDLAQVSATTLRALPSSWSYSDAGYQTTPGNATYSSGTFIVKGAGLDYGGGSSDSFGFAYLNMTGDGTIIARYVTRTNYSGLNKAGLTMRESLAEGSKHVFLLFDGTSTNYMIYRSSTGGNGSSSGSAHISGASPEWLKLTRTGNVFTGSVSPDGTNWTVINSETVTMNNTILVGFAVCSRNNGVLDTGVFDNVSVTGLWPALPGTPTDFIAVPGNSSAFLNWSAATNATGYNLKRANSSDGPFALVATNLSNLYFTDAGLVNGALYYYEVSGTNFFGESANSSPVSVRPISSSPPTMGFTLADNQMGFNWPTDHIGWELQAQTNSLAVGLGTNWATIAGSDATNQWTIPLNPGNGSVFFRLIHP